MPLIKTHAALVDAIVRAVLLSLHTFYYIHKVKDQFGKINIVHKSELLDRTRIFQLIIPFTPSIVAYPKYSIIRKKGK